MGGGNRPASYVRISHSVSMNNHPFWLREARNRR